MIETSRDKLENILKEIKNPSISLQKINDLYFQAKDIIFGNDNIGEEELSLSINIFQEGDLIVRKFVLKWENEEIKPSEQELDLLLILCDEGMNNWDYLGSFFPSIFTKEQVKKRQREVKIFRENILKEKSERTMLQSDKRLSEVYLEKEKESLQARINKLTAQINSLQNKSRNGERKARMKSHLESLEKELTYLKREPSSSSSHNFFSVEKFLIGFVICVIILFVFYFCQKKKKKHNL